jgi:2-polyprenyl-3-methyl-5-hydroxy-6-metoxy-1,4-benzoquinol methylase
MSVRHLPLEIDETANRFFYYETWWKRRGIELLLKHCRPAGKTLLDYGSGRGECLKIATEAGFKAQGTDVDPECVKLSSRFGPACLLKPDGPLFQFGARSFDVVTCFHVLEHVDSPKAVLGALAEISREFVVLAVPNLRNFERPFTRNVHLSFVNEGHLQSWDHWHLLNLAETHCGLRLVEWGTDATILPLVSRLAQQFLGRKSTIRLETGVFRKWFPFHGISVLGLFRPNR